jgi:hypothetical protein
VKEEGGWNAKRRNPSAKIAAFCASFLVVVSTG